MKKLFKRLAPMAAAALATLSLAPTVHALDVDPGDYTALPAGTNLAIVYYQHATRDKLYSQGNKVPINPGLDSDVGLLRMVHFMEAGGYIIDPQFILPFGRLKAKDDIAALGKGSGIGDLLVGGTIWFNQPGAKTHFGITPFISLPTGEYDRNKALNLGENRWKFILNAGYITEIAPGWNWDVIGDVTIFGKNDDVNDGLGGVTDLKQKPTYQFQTYLRYNLSPALDLRGGLSHLFGGETKVGGVNQDNRLATTKFNFGAAYFVAPTTQLLATWGRDLKVKEGFKVNSEIHLRLLQIF